MGLCLIDSNSQQASPGEMMLIWQPQLQHQLEATLRQADWRTSTLLYDLNLLLSLSLSLSLSLYLSLTLCRAKTLGQGG